MGIKVIDHRSPVPDPNLVHPFDTEPGEIYEAVEVDGDTMQVRSVKCLVMAAYVPADGYHEQFGTRRIFIHKDGRAFPSTTKWLRKTDSEVTWSVRGFQ